MAGKLSFQFSLDGVDNATAKLKGLESLTQKISKGITAQDLFKATQGNFSSSTLAKNKELFASLGRQAAEAFNKGAQQSGYLGAFINQSMGIGAGQNRPNRQNYQYWWRNTLPPVLAPPVLGGSGGGGGIFNTVLGGLGGGGGLGKFGLALIGITSAAQALRSAFEKLKESVYTGAKLYTDAAKLGKDPGKLYGLRSALNLAGLSESQADLLMLYGEFPRTQSSGRGGLSGGQVRGRSGASATVGGTTFGAGRGVRQIGELQEISNLYDVINRGLKETAADSAVMANNAKSLFEQRYALERFKGEWNTVWSQLADAIGTLAIPLIRDFTTQLKDFNIALLSLVEGSGLSMLKDFLGLGGQANFNQIGSGSNSRIPANQFQHMGFVFGAGNYQPHEYAKKTADATTKTATAVQTLVKIVGGGGTFNPMGIMSGGMNFNMP